MSARPTPARLGPVDMLALGSHGMRTRPMRAVLSALGIAIGIAAMVAVLAIPASSAKALQDQLAALGTNLLKAEPGESFLGTAANLPEDAVALLKRITPVTGAAAVGATTAKVYRSDHIAANETSGLKVLAADAGLFTEIKATLAAGKLLDPALAKLPTVVLGSEAAKRLGIGSLDPQHPPQVWLDGQFFTVVGILNPLPLATDIERAVLVGWQTAVDKLGFDGKPTTVYIHAKDSQVVAVQSVLGATLNPEHPNEVKVSRPSDALAAKNLVQDSYDALFLGLGGVALLVGGVGVANTMVISVLERRREIGLRRALGATRRQVWGQFVAESMLLSALGGAAGVLIGVLATGIYALAQGWPAVIPIATLLGGVGLSLLVGAVAGAYPSMRAARLPPTQALA
ncbi:ABC transporter permease [Amycolatopsis sp. cg5]|uniref:ABC transporter permease n=1 Tax=Amycolatopsis sp. cg5 TaxID=3238802 RepID=UPI003525DF7B